MLLTPESLSKNSQIILNKAHDMGIENVFVYSVDTQFDVVQGFIIDDPKRELIDSKTKSEFEDYLKNFFDNKWLDVEQKAGFSPDSFSVHKTALDTAILISELKPDKSFLEQFQEQQQKSLKKGQEIPPEKRQRKSTSLASTSSVGVSSEQTSEDEAEKYQALKKAGKEILDPETQKRVMDRAREIYQQEKSKPESSPEKSQGSSLQYPKDKGHSLPGAS